MFAMEYQYANWNRMLEMTYPDGEIVSYSYDAGGNRCRMVGNKTGELPFAYIKDIAYNQFGLLRCRLHLARMEYSIVL